MSDQNAFADACLARDRYEATLAALSVIEEAVKLVKYRAALEKLHHGALWPGRLRRMQVGGTTRIRSALTCR
jgi:hypothetical protein